jgi:hypothetical protein
MSGDPIGDNKQLNLIPAKFESHVAHLENRG